MHRSSYDLGGGYEGGSSDEDGAGVDWCGTDGGKGAVGGNQVDDGAVSSVDSAAFN